MADFTKQIDLAKAKQASSQFASNQLQNYIHKIDKNKIDEIISQPDFEYMMSAAYSHHLGEHGDNTGLGISIRTNPHTGEKEMFVAGSQGWKDWTLNVVDAVYYGGEKLFHKPIDKAWEKYTNLPAYFRPKLYEFDLYRQEREKKISEIAKSEHVDTIYGHSRGGAVVADLDYSGRKIGLDAAMIIAANTEMPDYKRPGLFDYTLGLTGKQNVTVNTGHGIHWAYGDGY